MTHQKKSGEKLSIKSDRAVKLHVLGREAKEINTPPAPLRTPEQWEAMQNEDREIWEAEQAGDSVSF